VIWASDDELCPYSIRILDGKYVLVLSSTKLHHVSPTYYGLPSEALWVAYLFAVDSPSPLWSESILEYNAAEREIYDAPRWVDFFLPYFGIVDRVNPGETPPQRFRLFEISEKKAAGEVPPESEPTSIHIRPGEGFARPRDDNLLWFALLAIMLIVGISFGAYRYYKKNKKKIARFRVFSRVDAGGAAQSGE
jgi:hypothetical protein